MVFTMSFKLLWNFSRLIGSIFNAKSFSSDSHSSVNIISSDWFLAAVWIYSLRISSNNYGMKTINENNGLDILENILFYGYLNAAWNKKLMYSLNTNYPDAITFLTPYSRSSVILKLISSTQKAHKFYTTTATLCNNESSWTLLEETVPY